MLTRTSVVTQFSEDFVTQFFIQDGVKIETPAPAYPNFPDVSGLNAEYCEVRPVEFEDIDRFGGVGGFNRHVEMLSQPMVLTMAIQDDVSQGSSSPIYTCLLNMNYSTGPGTSGSTRCIPLIGRVCRALAEACVISTPTSPTRSSCGHQRSKSGRVMGH